MATKKQFLVIWICCIIGAVALVPYLYYLNIIPEISPLLIAFAFSQSTIIYGIVCFLSYLLVRRVDLQPFIFENPLRRIFFPGILWGIVLGFVIIGLEISVFQLPVTWHLPFWPGIFPALYEALSEEVFSRLFALTLIYFLVCKIFRNHEKYRPLLVWSSIIAAALLYALMPALVQFDATHSVFEMSRIFVPYTIGGIVFGWLYCTKGFWTAVTAHFTTNLIMDVFSS